MKRFLVLSLVLFLVGCSFINTAENEKGQFSNPIEQKGNETGLIDTNNVTVIAANMNIPWSINKIGNDFYVSERVGTLVKIEEGKIERQKVNLSEELSSASEAGLLGFILAPDFEQSLKAFAYYTYTYQGKPTNRIVELKYEHEEWNEHQILLDNIPSGVVHHGGRLKIGPDQKLYATTGDAAHPENAQDLNSLAGKILRLNLDGTIPDDNPVPGSYVYSYGHRNPQGIAWDSEGDLYGSEHGNSANDEINLIKPGKNYGWPIIQGYETNENMESPLFTSGKDTTWAPSGMVYHKGNLYVAALRGTSLLKFNLSNGEITKIITKIGRIRDVWLDGNTLYFISNNTDGRGTPTSDDDKLYKIEIE